MCREVFNYFCTFVPKLSVSLHSVVAITGAGAKPTTSIRLMVLYTIWFSFLALNTKMIIAFKTVNLIRRKQLQIVFRSNSCERVIKVTE